MTILVRNFIVSFSLAVSDLFSFVISLYLAVGVLSITSSDYQNIYQAEQLEGWKALHWLLAFVVLLGTQCVYAITSTEKRSGLNSRKF